MLLGHRDSGLPGWASGSPRAARWPPPTRCRWPAGWPSWPTTRAPTTLIHDDEHGIYGHPDHRATYRIGATAAELVGATGYRMTVDREHLHVSARDGHLVHGAARAAAVPFGRPTVEISLAVAGGPEHLLTKRAAMTAHASQIAEEDVPPTGSPPPTASSGSAAASTAGRRALPACSTRWATPTCSPRRPAPRLDPAARSPRRSTAGLIDAARRSRQ